MKYKLKEHVTDEMLVEVGYRVIHGGYRGVMCVINDRFDIFINRDEYDYPKNHILRNIGKRVTKKRIQHLIDKNYVEVVE